MSGAESASEVSSPNKSSRSRLCGECAMDISKIPVTALQKILFRLDRDDVARSCVVCRHWSKTISSDFFLRSYRKQHKNYLGWVWVAACVEQQPQQQQQIDHTTTATTASTSDSPSIFHLLAWNVHHRKCFKLLEILPCPDSRTHPKSCWFEFAAVDSLLAWACRHTPSSIRVGNPLKPSSVTSLPDLPPFPENVFYEFRLGLDPMLHGTGYRLAVLRLGWPHSEASNAQVLLSMNVYTSTTGQWKTNQVKVNQELKRWGASAVCKGVFYVILRPPNKREPEVGLLTYNLNAGGADPWFHMEVPLPFTAHGHEFDWRTKMDLVDRNGSLVLVAFQFEACSLKIFQADENLSNLSNSNNNSSSNNRSSHRSSAMAQQPRMRWVLLNNMPTSTCRQLCQLLGSAASYRCRGFSDYIFFMGPQNGICFIFWCSRKSWHRMDISTIRDENSDNRYVFALAG